VPSRRCADLAWPDLEPHRGLILAVPVGATEQHGPHLPLSTDTDIAVALCEGLARALDDLVVAPPLGYGSSGEHAGFPGTLSIGQDALRVVLVELVRSASSTYGAVVLVSAHGGNADPVNAAVEQLRGEGHQVIAVAPAWEGDPHAGRIETSLMLALRPESVRTERARPGDTRPLSEVLPILRRDGVRAVTDSGVLGDPTGASAVEGHALLSTLTASLVEQVAAWRAASPR
jgi:creatinine amidohydrolase